LKQKGSYHELHAMRDKPTRNPIKGSSCKGKVYIKLDRSDNQAENQTTVVYDTAKKGTTM